MALPTRMIRVFVAIGAALVAGPPLACSSAEGPEDWQDADGAFADSGASAGDGEWEPAPDSPPDSPWDHLPLVCDEQLEPLAPDWTLDAEELLDGAGSYVVALAARDHGVFVAGSSPPVGAGLAGARVSRWTAQGTRAWTWTGPDSVSMDHLTITSMEGDSMLVGTTRQRELIWLGLDGQEAQHIELAERARDLAASPTTGRVLVSSTSYEGFVTEPPPEDPRETVHAVDVYDTTGSLLWSRNLGTERFALVQSDENGAVFAWDGPPHGIWLDPEGEVVDVGVFEQETSETAAVPAALTVADGGRFALAARPKDGIGHYVQVHDRDANGPVSAPSWRLALVAHDSWVSDLEFHDDTLWVAGSAPDGRSWLVALDPGGQPVTCGSLPLASVDDVEISDDGESVYVLGSDGESSAVARLTL